MKFLDSNIIGVIEILPHIHSDCRGTFIKTFNLDRYNENSIYNFDFKEEYYSVSKKNVLRGLHFQLPPNDHEKLVYCVYGEVLDVFLDLRRESRTFGKAGVVKLNSATANILYLPKGIAHGFLTLTNEAIMIYKTTTVYDPESDCGLHWKSCEKEFSIGSVTPIVSDRDQRHILFDDFITPFEL